MGLDTIKVWCKHLLIKFPLTRALISAPVSQPRVLMYHRINDNPLTRGISPEIFDEQLIALKRYFNILSLDDYANVEFDRGNKKPTLLVTFDDGHRDFYLNAWPRLKARQIPAVLFISTEFVDTKAWLWPDKLRFVLHEANLKSAADWHLHSDLLLTRDAQARDAYINQLAQQHHISVPAQPPEIFAPLSWDELITMQGERFAGIELDIQSHTHSHALLTQLTASEIHNEIARSQSLLTQHLGKPSRALAYPNGRAQDINQQAVDTARALGFSQGFLAENYLSNDPLTQGRIAASDNTYELIWRLLRNKKLSCN